MKIEGRKKKIESDKKIQILKMYMIFLDYGTIYDYELGLDCTKEKDNATFRRYANELHRIGAIPKVRLKKKTIQNPDGNTALYYFYAKDVKIKEPKPFNKVFDPELGKEVDLYNPNSLITSNHYHVFRFYRKPTRNRLARIACMIYWMKTRPLHIGERGKQEIRNMYNKLNPNASDKTFQRDESLRLYALYSYLGIDEEDFDEGYFNKKYRKYLNIKNKN